MEQAAQAGLTFWQWLDNQTTRPDWADGVERIRQLMFEAQQEKFDAIKHRKSSKKYIALDRAGWPEGGTNCKILKSHDSEASASKDGLAVFGRRKFQIILLSRFMKTKQAIYLARRFAIRQRLNLFKKH